MDGDKKKENVGKEKGGILKMFSPKSWRKKQNKKTDERSLSPDEKLDEQGKENSSFNANRTPSKIFKNLTGTLRRQLSIDRKKKKGGTETNITPRINEATDKKEKLDDGEERRDGNIQNENQKTETVEEIEEETSQSPEDKTNQKVDEADDFNVYSMRRNSENKIGMGIEDDIEKIKIEKIEDAEEIKHVLDIHCKFEGIMDAECKKVMDHFDKITESLEASIKPMEYERMTEAFSQELIYRGLSICSINAEKDEETNSAQDSKSMAAEELVQDNQLIDDKNIACEENQNRKTSIDSNRDSINTEDEVAREHIQDVTSFAPELIENHRHDRNPENEQNMNVTNDLRNTNKEDQQTDALNEHPTETEEVADRRSDVTLAVEQFVTSLKENSELIGEQVAENTEEIVQNNRHDGNQNTEVLTTDFGRQKIGNQCNQQELEANIPEKDTRFFAEPRNNVTSVKEEEETVPLDDDFRKSCELEGGMLPEAICNMNQEELDEIRNRTIDTVEAYLFSDRITREENEQQYQTIVAFECQTDISEVASQEELDEVRSRTIDTVEAYLIPARITREEIEQQCQTKVAFECQTGKSEVAMPSSGDTQEQEERTIESFEMGSSAEDQEFLSKESARILNAKLYYKYVDDFYKKKNAARSINERFDQFLENRVKQLRKIVAAFFSTKKT